MSLYRTRSLLMLVFVFLMVLLAGCGDHSPKAGEDSHTVHDDLARRIIVDHGIDKPVLVKDLRALLSEAMRYVGKICVRLKSKCPAEPVLQMEERDDSMSESNNHSAEDGEGSTVESEAEQSKEKGGDQSSSEDDGSQDETNDDSGEEQSGADTDENEAKEDDDEKEPKEDDDEKEPKENDDEKQAKENDQGQDAKQDSDTEAISTTVEAGVADEAAEKPKKEQPDTLSKEANELMDVIFELGQSYPSLLPSLKDASAWIVEDYKTHESETSDNVQLYIPFQLLRMYFDLVLKIKGQSSEEPLSLELLHVYSMTSFEILRSVMFHISQHRDAHFKPDHIPHEIQAMTKASELLKSLKGSSDHEENHNIARRLVVKIFIGISDMFVLARGIEHGHKLSTDLVHLYDACVEQLERIPDILDNHLMNTNELKNDIWLARSEIFKTGKLGGEGRITKLIETVHLLAKGELSEDGSDMVLGRTASFDTNSKRTASGQRDTDEGEGELQSAEEEQEPRVDKKVKQVEKGAERETNGEEDGGDEEESTGDGNDDDGE